MKISATIIIALMLALPFAYAQESQSAIQGSVEGTTRGLTQSSQNIRDFAELSDIERDTGEDIIINVEDYQPSIVDANLIENQNVPITALLKGIPTNPTVTIPKIKNIRIRSTNVTVFPADKRASSVSVRYLRPRDQDLSFDNLGYAVVTLGRIPREEDVPDSIIVGVKADIDVDVFEGAGINVFEDVLREQSLDEWKDERFRHQSFVGFVHAKEIKDGYAVFDFYDNNMGLVIKDMRVNLGSTSRPLRSTDFVSSSYRGVFDKFKIQVNDIRKQTEKVWLYVEREGKVEMRVVREGQQLYPGSAWKVHDIITDKNSDKVDLVLRDSRNNQFIFGIKKSLAKLPFVSEPEGEETVDLSRQTPLDQAEIVTKSKGAEIGAGVEDNYNNALVAYRKVVDDYSGFDNEGFQETVKKSQEGIVRSYEGLTEIGGKGIIENIVEIDKLIEITNDDLKRRTLEIKKQAYDLIRKNYVSEGRFLEDYGGGIFVIPFSYEEAKNTDAVATLRVGPTNKLDLKQGQEFDDPIDGKKWKIDRIDVNQIDISRVDENAAVRRENIKQGTIFCSNKDEKDKSKCITLLSTEVGREVFITIMPDPERAYTTAAFNLHINIDKRAFGIPLFSESLDAEIQKTEKLIEKLNGVIENARKLHEFWTKFCFITFGVLWSTTFFGNVLGLSRGNAARDKINDKWHTKYQEQSEYNSYDKYIFANQEDYEIDLENAENVLDEIYAGKHEVPAGVDIGSDDGKDWYFYKRMAEINEDPVSQKIFLVRDAEIRKTGIDNEVAAVMKKDFSSLSDDNKANFKIYVANKPYYKDNPKLLALLEKDDYSQLYAETKNDGTLARMFKNDLMRGKSSTFDSGVKGVANEIGYSLSDDEFIQLKARYFGFAVSNRKSGDYLIDLREPWTDDEGSYIYDYNEVDKLYLDDGDLRLNSKTGDNVGSYKIANTPELISKKLMSTHQAKVSLLTDGRNKGKVEAISVDPNLEIWPEYSSSGVITGYKVYERIVDNDALGSKNSQIIGNYNEVLQRYKELGKNDPLVREKAKRLEESKECISKINRKLSGKELKEGEILRGAGCKVSDYAVKQAHKELGSSCTDFMSPINCKRLFNACDPVICPTSRCNWGGNWQVDNVVQSGLIGSSLLCIKNSAILFPSEGDIYTLPVCLTGIVAGLENIESILESYKQCLVTAKIDGTSVGICDRLRNFYMCDTLWREAVAIFNVKGGLLGALSEEVFDAGSGGGEYATFKQSFDDAVDGLEFFTQDYAKQVFAGYAGGSLDEIGTEICKAAIYGKVPGVGNIFEEVVKPESPPQYTAFFDEKFYSDIKGYRESVYNYFYHIYAGSRDDLTYSVYLRAVDTAEQPIGGYQPITIARSKRIATGGFATENKPVIAPEGYNQICVDTSSRTYGRDIQCGFGKTTTSFGINYLVDEYVTGEINTKNIKSEAECVPETKGYSVKGQGLVKGIAATGVGGLSTGFLQAGILRRCSAYSPGIGGGEDKWVPVGNCGRDDRGRDLGTCWLYTEGITDLVQNKANVAAIEGNIQQIREEAKKQGLEALGVEIMESNQAKKILDNIEKELDDQMRKLKIIDAGRDDNINNPEIVKKMREEIDSVLQRSYDIGQHARAYYLTGLLYEIAAKKDYLADIYARVTAIAIVPETSIVIKSEDSNQQSVPTKEKEEQIVIKEDTTQTTPTSLDTNKQYYVNPEAISLNYNSLYTSSQTSMPTSKSIIAIDWLKKNKVKIRNEGNKIVAEWMPSQIPKEALVDLIYSNFNPDLTQKQKDSIALIKFNTINVNPRMTISEIQEELDKQNDFVTIKKPSVFAFWNSLAYGIDKDITITFDRVRYSIYELLEELRAQLYQRYSSEEYLFYYQIESDGDIFLTRYTEGANVIYNAFYGLGDFDNPVKITYSFDASDLISNFESGELTACLVNNLKVTKDRNGRLAGSVKDEIVYVSFDAKNCKDKTARVVEYREDPSTGEKNFIGSKELRLTQESNIVEFSRTTAILMAYTLTPYTYISVQIFEEGRLITASTGRLDENGFKMI